MIKNARVLELIMKESLEADEKVAPLILGSVTGSISLMQVDPANQKRTPQMGKASLLRVPHEGPWHSSFSLL